MSVPNQLFEAALGIALPWYVKGVEFAAEGRTLTIGIDFSADARFPAAGSDAALPVHDPVIKGLRWSMLKDRSKLSGADRVDLNALIASVATNSMARAWLYRESLRDVLERKQINVVSAMLLQWCSNVLRPKVEPVKEVAQMIGNHVDGIVAWTQTSQTNGFLAALNGLFLAAKRKARGNTQYSTMQTVLFLITGKLEFLKTNDHAA